jgi:hypothetical protein
MKNGMANDSGTAGDSSAAGYFIEVEKSINADQNEPSITPLPIMATTPFDRCFRPKPLIKNPRNGKSGISKIKFFML